MPASVRATSSARLARVEADFFLADVDRVAAERRDRHLDRNPRARRRLLEQRGDTVTGRAPAAPSRGRPSTRSARSRSAASATGSRSSTSRSDRVMRRPPHRPRRGPRRGSRPLRRSRRRVTSSDGASRSALAVTALTIKPASRHRCATALASMPSASSAASRRPSAAHVDDAGHLLQRSGRAGRPRVRPARERSRAPSRRAPRSAARAASGWPPNVVAWSPGRERCGDFGPGPARTDRHAVAERLGHRDDVGPDAAVLEAEPAAGAPEPGLHLVHDEQRFAFVAQPRAPPARYSVRRGFTPPSPCTGSSITAATRSSIAAASASRSSNAT